MELNYQTLTFMDGNPRTNEDRERIVKEMEDLGFQLIDDPDLGTVLLVDWSKIPEQSRQLIVEKLKDLEVEIVKEDEKED